MLAIRLIITLALSVCISLAEDHSGSQEEFYTILSAVEGEGELPNIDTKAFVSAIAAGAPWRRYVTPLELKSGIVFIIRLRIESVDQQAVSMITVEKSELNNGKRAIIDYESALIRGPQAKDVYSRLLSEKIAENIRAINARDEGGKNEKAGTLQKK